MAQGRILLRSLGSSRKFAAVPGNAGNLPAAWFAQLLYCLLIPHTDDFGRMSADAFTVKLQVLPSSDQPESVFDSALAILHQSGLIIRYQVGGEWFLQVVKFESGQPGLRLDRRAAHSKFPDPPPESLSKSAKCRETPGNAGKEQETPVVRSLREGKGREGKGTQDPVGADAPPSPVPDLIDHYHARFIECVGTPPKIDGKKHGAILKALSTKRGAEEVRAVMDAMFDSADPWVRQSGYELGWMSSQYNRLLVAVRGARPAQHRSWQDNCQHMPRCDSYQMHEQAQIRDMKTRIQSERGAA